MDVMALPVCVKQFADAMHQQVALVRKGAMALEVDLSDFTDLEVLAILEWSQKNTPPPMKAEHTMIGLFATMRTP